MKFMSAIAGATMLAGGIAKLMRVPAYERLVDGLDWSDDERQAIGFAELFGAALMLTRPGRRLGAGLVLAASGATLPMELRAGRTELAGARVGVMLCALLVAAVA